MIVEQAFLQAPAVRAADVGATDKQVATPTRGDIVAGFPPYERRVSAELWNRW